MEKEVNENLLIKEREDNNTESDAEEESVKLKDKLWSESKKMWIVAGPAIFTGFSTFGTNVISQALIGHIGSTQLAAYSLVFTVIVGFCGGILAGMAIALETVCGQAYGAKQHHMLGIYLQRSWIVLSMCSLILLPVFFFTTPILKALGQESYIAEEAGIISPWLIPVLLSYIPSFTCQMFLQAQSKNRIIAYLAAATLGIHIFLSWLLTMKFKYGIPGAMISTILALWIPNVGQVLFVTCGGCRETWKGFSMLAFKDLWPVIKLSLSSGVMLCLEVWYNTIMALLTGHLKNAEIAIDALAICMNINEWGMMISFGFMAAASVRVSNELGRGSSKAAKFSIVVIVVASFAIGFALFLVFLFLRWKLSYIFTENDKVVNEVANLSPLLAFSILMNSIRQVLLGVAVGAGWQSIVACVNLTCYYLVGIPVGVILGYVANMQVKGIWYGIWIGTFTQTVILTIITYKTKWEKQVTVSRNQINRWSVPDSQEHNTEDA